MHLVLAFDACLCCELLKDALAGMVVRLNTEHVLNIEINNVLFLPYGRITHLG